MNHLTQFGGGVFQWVLQTTWQAAVLAGLILLAQRLARNVFRPPGATDSGCCWSYAY